MNWNHRVWRTMYNEEETLEIKETYYNDSGEVCGCTENVATVYGFSMSELKTNLERMIRAVDNSNPKDILDTAGFKFGKWD